MFKLIIYPGKKPVGFSWHGQLTEIKFSKCAAL